MNTQQAITLADFYDADRRIVRAGHTYWGRPNRPVHVFTEHPDGRRNPTLCGLRIDGGSGHGFVHLDKITCKRCAARMTELLNASAENAKENAVPETSKPDHSGDPLQRCMHCKWCGYGLHRWSLNEPWISVFGNVQCEKAPLVDADNFGGHEPGSPVATRPEPEQAPEMVVDLSVLPKPVIPWIPKIDR